MNHYISVIIPIYNRKEFILKALNSIPKRDDIDVIVIDDGSTDGLFDIIKQTPIKITFVRIPKNRGVGYCRNIGIDISNSTWIAWLDSDDWYYNNINNVFDELYKSESYDILYFAGENNSKRKIFGGCETCLGIVKSKLYDLSRFPAFNRAEDYWWKKKIFNKYPNLKVKKYDVLAYHYNYPHNGSLTWNWKNKKLQNSYTEKELNEYLK